MKRIAKKFCSFILFNAVLAVPFGSGLQAAEPPQAPLAQGNSAFAIDLYQKLASEKGNLFFSPYSVSQALGMTYSGARGNTAAEMKQTLHFPFAQKELGPAFKAFNGNLLTAVRKDGQKLTIANGLCLTGEGISKDYQTLLREDYDAEVFSGDLAAINGWVKRKTEDKIPTILEELDPNSACVLLNAIYFKGAWECSFDKKFTREGDFMEPGEKPAKVLFMKQESKFRLLEKPDFQAVSLPYKGKSVSMVILLPTSPDGLTKLEQQLTPETLRQWLAELDTLFPQKIELILPKYKLETDYKLIPTCKQLGIKDAFSLGNR